MRALGIINKKPIIRCYVFVLFAMAVSHARSARCTLVLLCARSQAAESRPFHCAAVVAAAAGGGRFSLDTAAPARSISCTYTEGLYSAFRIMARGWKISIDNKCGVGWLRGGEGRDEGRGADDGGGSDAGCGGDVAHAATRPLRRRRRHNRGIHVLCSCSRSRVFGDHYTAADRLVELSLTFAPPPSSPVPTSRITPIIY